MVVKDSHLLMYDLVDHSQLLTEPKGVLYMGADMVVSTQDEEENQGEVSYYISVFSRENENESISLCAASEEERDR